MRLAILNVAWACRLAGRSVLKGARAAFDELIRDLEAEAKRRER